MSREHKGNKENKKKPTMTAKERKTAKRARKHPQKVLGIIPV